MCCSSGWRSAALIYALILLRRLWTAGGSAPARALGASAGDRQRRRPPADGQLDCHPAADHPQHPAARARSGARARSVRECSSSPASSIPKPPPPESPFLIVGIAALIVSVVWLRARALRDKRQYLVLGHVSDRSAAAVGGLLLQADHRGRFRLPTAAAQANGDALPIWSQIIFISAGVALIVAAYVVWQRAFKQDGDRRFVVGALAAVLLVIGGYALAVELPQALANADPDVLSGFNITVMFAVGTVPFQLAIGLGLAYLLFQNIKANPSSASSTSCPTSCPSSPPRLSST